MKTFNFGFTVSLIPSLYRGSRTWGNIWHLRLIFSDIKLLLSFFHFDFAASLVGSLSCLLHFISYHLPSDIRKHWGILQSSGSQILERAMNSIPRFSFELSCWLAEGTWTHHFPSLSFSFLSAQKGIHEVPPLYCPVPWWLSWLKNLPALQETQVWSLSWENSLEKEMATHCTILAWGIPWTEEPGGLSSTGSQE